jgi:hypothetical protein
VHIPFQNQIHRMMNLLHQPNPAVAPLFGMIRIVQPEGMRRQFDIWQESECRGIDSDFSTPGGFDTDFDMPPQPTR